MKHVVTFFSQTGSEINEIRLALHRDPDLIVTNRKTLDGVCPELIRDCGDKIVFLPRKPKLEDYETLISDHRDIFEDCIITLHGYLRIIPGPICERYEIYNGHPGYIVSPEVDPVDSHEDLKGFNPQERAWRAGYEYSGSVIHNVTAGVDEGSIISYKKVSIKNKTLDEVYEILHDNSINLWVDFLKNLLK